MDKYFLLVGGKYLSGKHITQLQENFYMKNRQSGCTQETSAAKAGISVRSGRRLEKGKEAQQKKRHWRTRKDPLETVWESELVPLLEREPSLTGITLWDYLDEKYPEQYPERLLRTLQRRVKHWQATQGPGKDVIFRQSVPAGHQGLSDFTHPDTAITIGGKAFTHLLYQFRLAYSGWRSVHIIQGGESYSALAEGLQNALHQLGGVPQEHRTDSLSAAYVNTVQKQRLTDDYHALCQHYGLRPTTNNLGVSHEYGAIEAPHGSLKRRIEQAIKLRGSADFSSLRAYRAFIDRLVDKLNKRCKGRLAEEQQVLKRLPQYRFVDYTELTVKVTTSSTLSVKRVLYTVPSRLIGENIRVTSIMIAWNALWDKPTSLRCLESIPRRRQAEHAESITGTLFMRWPQNHKRFDFHNCGAIFCRASTIVGYGHRPNCNLHPRKPANGWPPFYVLPLIMTAKVVWLVNSYGKQNTVRYPI